MYKCSNGQMEKCSNVQMQKCADVHVYKFLKLRNNCLISLQEDEKINKDEYKMLYFMFKTGSTMLFIK